MPPLLSVRASNTQEEAQLHACTHACTLANGKLSLTHSLAQHAVPLPEQTGLQLSGLIFFFYPCNHACAGPTCMHHSWAHPEQLTTATCAVNQEGTEKSRGMHFIQTVHTLCVCDAASTCVRSLICATCLLMLVLMYASKIFLVRCSCQLVTENKQRGRAI